MKDPPERIEINREPYADGRHYDDENAKGDEIRPAELFERRFFEHKKGKNDYGQDIYENEYSGKADGGIQLLNIGHMGYLVLIEHIGFNAVDLYADIQAFPALHIIDHEHYGGMHVVNAHPGRAADIELFIFPSIPVRIAAYKRDGGCQHAYYKQGHGGTNQYFNKSFHGRNIAQEPFFFNNVYAVR